MGRLAFFGEIHWLDHDVLGLVLLLEIIFYMPKFFLGKVLSHIFPVYLNGGAVQFRKVYHKDMECGDDKKNGGESQGVKRKRP
jgi:hypothetical protein